MLEQIMEDLEKEAKRDNKAKEILEYLRDYKYLRQKYLSYKDFEYNQKPMCILASSEFSKAYIGFASGLQHIYILKRYRYENSGSDNHFKNTWFYEEASTWRNWMRLILQVERRL